MPHCTDCNPAVHGSMCLMIVAYKHTHVTLQAMPCSLVGAMFGIWHKAEDSACHSKPQNISFARQVLAIAKPTFTYV